MRNVLPDEVVVETVAVAGAGFAKNKTQTMSISQYQNHIMKDLRIIALVIKINFQIVLAA